MRRQSEQIKSPLKTIQSLHSFKLNYQEKAPIYHTATTIPQFLVDNLKSEHRVIKEFTGQDALIKAFYFNLMKLAFQLQNQQTDYTQLVKSILIGQQQFGDGELQDKKFTDKQYRSFLREFFNLLEGQQIPNFEETIQYFPIIDEILLKMFKQLVPFTLKLKDSADFQITRRIFQYLSKKFKIQMQVISGCFKFLQSDIFVYVSSVSQVYLIFMDQLAFIKEVTEEASSYCGSRLNKSNNSMNRGNQNTSIINSKTQIKNKQNCSSSDKKVFTTVINMLDSKKFPSDSSNSVKGRNSIEQDLNKQINAYDYVLDKISQKERSSVQQYYDMTHISQREQYATSKPVYRDQKIRPLLNADSLLVKQRNDRSRLSSPSHQTIQDRSSVRNNEFNLSSPNKSHNQSGFQFNRDSNRVPKLAKTQSYTQNNQKISPRHTPIRRTFNSQSISVDSDFRVHKEIVKNNFKDESEIKLSVDMFKKPAFEPSQTSKMYSHATKNSNLQIFSNIKDKNSIFDSKYSKFQNLPNRLFHKNEVKQKQNDNSYQKFTDSGLLQILDEQYRTRIRSIKQKYRQQRTKVQPGI